MDYQRIDRYMDFHFDDEVGDKVCRIYSADEPTDNTWNLQYLEERVNLQEYLIDHIAYHLGIENKGMAYSLTKRSSSVDEYLYEIYGKTFSSPICNDRKIDIAWYCYEMEPEIYYDIAQTIIAGEVDNAIIALEEAGEYQLGIFTYKLEEYKGEE